VSTHDLPTIPGVWTGADLKDQEQTGLEANEEGSEAHRTRLQELTGLDDGASVADVVLATYRRLARAPSRIRVASLEDALRVEERPNVPGTTVERPNWCLALPLAIEELPADPLVCAVASTLQDPDGLTSL
jgi:4-alpha-glucanotransferase